MQRKTALFLSVVLMDSFLPQGNLQHNAKCQKKTKEQTKRALNYTF